MFRLVHRNRSASASAGALAVTGAALGAVALTAACGSDNADNGDPDPKADSTVSVCSDVPVHAWATMNIGTESRPDNRKVDYDVEATGHDRDPFSNNVSKACDSAAGAFGSQVKLTAPGLNAGKPYAVTAPPDRRHVLVVRFTKKADGTVAAAQELVAHG